EQYIRKKIYFSNTEFFIKQIGAIYLAIYIPENPEDEFILIDNSFNIYKGYIISI
ncbi:hypothetical protein BKA56DRAFT_482485, partial [Ilyonectria sp. MPI-CAGE-AT-0026]